MFGLNKTAIALFLFIFGAAIVAPAPARADEWNLTTRFTVNHPFQVPGLQLQANTPYVIRLLDSPSTRSVVQIYNEDQTRMLTMFMAVSAERPEPADHTVFTFIEMDPGSPLPIREWFYPGRLHGLEFVYPKEQAQEIAAHAQEPVLAASSADLHDLAGVTVEAIRPGKKSGTSSIERTKPEVEK